MARVPRYEFSHHKYEGRNNGSAQDSSHTLYRQVSMRMPAQTVAVAVPLLVGSVIVAVGMDVHV